MRHKACNTQRPVKTTPVLPLPLLGQGAAQIRMIGDTVDSWKVDLKPPLVLNLEHLGSPHHILCRVRVFVRG